MCGLQEVNFKWSYLLISSQDRRKRNKKLNNWKVSGIKYNLTLKFYMWWIKGEFVNRLEPRHLLEIIWVQDWLLNRFLITNIFTPKRLGIVQWWTVESYGLCIHIQTYMYYHRHCVTKKSSITIFEMKWLFEKLSVSVLCLNWGERI